MRTKLAKTYIIGALISWFILTGWLNAFFTVHFGALTQAEKIQNYCFCVAYAGAASTIWPAFIPAYYIGSGLVPEGWDIKPRT